MAVSPLWSPEQLKSSQAIDRFEFALGVFLQPARRRARLSSGIHNVDLFVSHLPLDPWPLSVAQQTQDVIETGRIAQIEESIMDLQHAADIDDGDRPGSAAR
ncbi:MAG: hypothetical protein JO095_10630 [Alphaproteobacteria bacterium]|nr:hypothetical protein [Alphaproteobacteria bacterium]